MNIITLNGKEFTSIEKVHFILKETLNLPDYYGENLNALWDCLTGWVNLPLKIQWTFFEESKIQLGEYANELYELFLEAQEKIKGFSIELQ